MRTNGWAMVAMIAMLLCLSEAHASPTSPTVLLIPLDAKDGRASAEFTTAIPLTTASSGVMFDLDGDGMVEQVAWTQPEVAVAFLAMDTNVNGKIDNGTELLSDISHPGAKDVFQALSRMLPINGLTGWLDDDDPLFDKLLLWTDRNHNGISEPGELRPAKELVARLGLGYSHLNRHDDQGNHFRFSGWFRLRSGPGLNGPAFGEDVQARMRSNYEVVLDR